MERDARVLGIREILCFAEKLLLDANNSEDCKKTAEALNRNAVALKNMYGKDHINPDFSIFISELEKFAKAAWCGDVKETNRRNNALRFSAELYGIDIANLKPWNSEYSKDNGTKTILPKCLESIGEYCPNICSRFLVIEETADALCGGRQDTKKLRITIKDLVESYEYVSRIIEKKKALLI